jgi:hypothetical protein
MNHPAFPTLVDLTNYLGSNQHLTSLEKVSDACAVLVDTVLAQEQKLGAQEKKIGALEKTIRALEDRMRKVEKELG